MEILIISGLSGAGKSRAASFLEDMGFYIVDNMPAAMILKFAEFCAGGSQRYDKVLCKALLLFTAFCEFQPHLWGAAPFFLPLFRQKSTFFVETAQSDSQYLVAFL